MRSSRLLSMLAVLLLACGAPTLAIENTVVLAPAIAARLLEAKPGQRIEVGAVPRNAGAQAPAVFKRIEVYAADARIVVMGDAGPVEVPRSRNLHYISVEGPRVALSLDPDTGAGEGLLIADDGINYSLAARSRDGGLELAIDRRADRTPAGIPLVYSSESRSDVREPSASQLLESSSSDSESTNAIDAVAGGTRQAVVAIDTDNEFMELKFGNSSTSATNYIAALFAQMNVIFERDLDLNLVQGTVILRPSSVTDPYPSTSNTDVDDQLDELGIWWRDNQSFVARAFVLLLSGKSQYAEESLGVAWLGSSGIYCSATGTGGSTNIYGHYSLNRVFLFNGATAASDTFVTPHELGHSLGASHTHCTSATTGNYPTSVDTIDRCWPSEATRGCYSGGISCPATQNINGVPNVTGTLMSYCQVQRTVACSAAKVFAPIQQTRLHERIAANFPGCITPTVGANQAPTLIAPSTIAATEDQTATINGVSFGDADAGSDTLTATFSVGEGTLDAAAGVGITVGGSANSRTIRGTLATLNAYLQGAGLSYQPLANAGGNRALSILIDDEGHNGSGGPRTASGNSSIAIAAVNDPPVLGVPPSIGTTEDTSVSFGGIGLTDIDSGTGNLTVTMAVAQGTLIAPPAAGIAISGSPGVSVLLTGTATTLTAYLATPNIGYMPVANFSGNLNLIVSASDGGNSGSGGARTDTETSTLQVAAVNDAPTLAAPTVIPISLGGSGPITGIVAGDIDVAGGSMTQTLSVPEGTLAASSQAGVTVTGSGTQNLVLTGTLSALNGFHAPTPRVTYAQAGSPSINVPLSIIVNDNGGTGSGGARTASAGSMLRTGTLFMNGFE